jgi:maleylacetate reductase
MQEKVIYGMPAAECVSSEAARLGVKKVFVLTTRSLADGPLVNAICRGLGDRFVGVYEKISSHTQRLDVIAATQAARQAGADLLVAVGGGSVIDATKVVQIGLTAGLNSTQDLDAFVTGMRLSQESATPSGGIRSIAVPTTLSAAEFTAFAGVTDERRGIKEIFHYEFQIPKVVILDPAATLFTPQSLFLSTGVRAIDHCVETFCSPGANPFSDAYSVNALRILSTALPGVVAAPEDLTLRLQCQFAMWMSIQGPATGVPIGASHGIGRILGSLYGVPHGKTSCILLAPVLRWNSSINGAKQDELMERLGLGGQKLPDMVKHLVNLLGEPGTLRQVGVTRPQFEELALKCFESGFLAHNPRHLVDATDVMAILELAE